MNGMNVLDYVFLGLVLIATIRGALVGLSRQLFGLFMVIAAVWAAGRFYPSLAPTLASGDRMEARTADIAAYILILAGVCTAFVLVRLFLRALIKFGFTPVIERVGGAAVGCIMGAISASAAMVVMSLIPHETIHTAVTKESWVGRRLNGAFPSFYRDLSTRYNLPDIKSLGTPEPAPSDAPAGPDQDVPTMEEPPPVEPVVAPPAE